MHPKQTSGNQGEPEPIGAENFSFQSGLLLSQILMMNQEGGSKSKKNVLDNLNTSLNEKELKFLQNLWTLQREEEIRSSLRNVSFEIDFGSINFQTKFFTKYVMMRHRDYHLEGDKSRNLVIKMSLVKQHTIDLTREKLDNFLSKFRVIYKSFNEVRSFLSDLAIKTFEERFDFEIFLAIEDEYQESIEFDTLSTPFRIKWMMDNKEVPYSAMQEDSRDKQLSEEEYRSYLLGILRPGLFAAVRTVTGIDDISNEKIAGFYFLLHKELFEFFAKSMRVFRLINIHQDQLDLVKAKGEILKAQHETLLQNLKEDLRMSDSLANLTEEPSQIDPFEACPPSPDPKEKQVSTAVVGKKKKKNRN